MSTLMRTRALSALVVCLSVATVTSICPADILNGDFTAAVDLDHWAKAELAAPDPGYASVQEVTNSGNDQLYLMAHNTYTWAAGSWLLNEYIGSVAQAMNPADYDLYAPAGTTALAFDAKVAVQAPAGDVATRLWVEVQYNYDGSVFDADEDIALAVADWAGYSIDLPGLDPAKQMSLNVYARSGDGLAGVTGQSDGQVVDLIAEGWFDNFQLVPEPASITLLTLGALAIGTRRKRG